jgi:hypothetical protein
MSVEPQRPVPRMNAPFQAWRDFAYDWFMLGNLRNVSDVSGTFRCAPLHRPRPEFSLVTAVQQSKMNLANCQYVTYFMRD